MAFRDVLSSIIEKSGLSIREIANRCTNNGVSLTHSYISQLKSGKVKPPADKVSAEIANVCGVHKDLLIIEAYLDNAPESLIKYITTSKDMVIKASLEFFKDKVPQMVYDFMENYLKNISLAEFIIASDSAKNEMDGMIPDINSIINSISSTDKDQITNTMFPFKLPMQDDSMSPMLPKNSKVYFEHKDSYNDGDIVCFKEVNGGEHFTVRTIYYQDREMILNPLNPEYKPKIYDPSNIVIFGKVKSATF